MPSEGNSNAAEPQAAIMSPQQLRLLRLAVVGMGVVLVLGFGLVIGRIVYLLNSPQTEAVTPAHRAGQIASTVALPEGAAIKNLALSGRQMAIHFEGPRGQGIIVIDTGTGAVLQRLDVRAEPPPKP